MTIATDYKSFIIAYSYCISKNCIRNIFGPRLEYMSFHFSNFVRTRLCINIGLRENQPYTDKNYTTDIDLSGRKFQLDMYCKKEEREYEE